MTDQKLHIIITGEKGGNRNFVLRKNLIRTVLAGLSITGVVLSAASIQGIRYFHKNNVLQQQVVLMRSQLQDRTAQLEHQLAATREALSTAREEKSRLTASYQDEVSTLTARYEQQIAKLREEQKNLLAGTISRLDERRRIIEAVMDHIGVKVEVREDPKHSGGPYISPDTRDSEKLILDTDRYLKILQQIPLGLPVAGTISSRFGRRKDPLLHKTAFHSGVDLRGKTGDKVRVTADGIVEKSAYNKGLGYHIIVDHGNGYKSVFAHLSKRLAKKGDEVQRGQVIGLLGNTGRSTGSHLHYEIRLHGKAINPMKYLEVAKLSLTVSR